MRKDAIHGEYIVVVKVAWVQQAKRVEGGAFPKPEPPATKQNIPKGIFTFVEAVSRAGVQERTARLPKQSHAVIDRDANLKRASGRSARPQVTM